MIFQKIKLTQNVLEKTTTCNEVCHNNHMITLKDYEKNLTLLKISSISFSVFSKILHFFLVFLWKFDALLC